MTRERCEEDWRAKLAGKTGGWVVRSKMAAPAGRRREFRLGSEEPNRDDLVGTDAGHFMRDDDGAQEGTR